MIKFLECDVFESGADVICHQVNCKGVMDSGVAKQIRDKFTYVYDVYKQKCSQTPTRKLLGTSQYVPVTTSEAPAFLGVFNLFGQKNFGHKCKRYTDYEALRRSFSKMKNAMDGLFEMTKKRYTIAVPYLIGCGRSGGEWDVVYDIICDVFSDCRYDILICKHKEG